MEQKVKGESEQDIAEDSRTEKPQRPKTFSRLLPPSPSIPDKLVSSSARSTRYPNKTSVLAHPSDPCHLTQVAASTASSNAGEGPFTAIGSADFDSMRLGIRGYLDNQYVGSVPCYSLLFQQDEVGQRLQPSNSSYAPRPARRCRQRFTAEEDRLLIKLKETDALSWEKIVEFFPSRSPGTLQVRYCTKLKVREVMPKKRRRKGRKT